MALSVPRGSRPMETDSEIRGMYPPRHSDLHLYLTFLPVSNHLDGRQKRLGFNERPRERLKESYTW